MDLTISTRVLPTCTVVQVAGEVDLSTEPELRRDLAAVVEREMAQVVVDLTGVAFLDSTGLGLLVWAFRRMQDRGGGLCLAGPQASVAKLLDLTSLDRLITVYDSVEAATEAIR
ncbi:MAG TPA: STAS domain-containing protein [Micromonosporaceae bacterium]|nr:STAS domain-containing protein [Micromonosporaceae bacterium]